MQDETIRSGSAVEMIKSIWGRRKWLAILVFAMPCIAAVSLIMFMPSLYRSTATILVDRQQVPETMVRPTVTSALETRLHTISQEILSRSRLDALIKQFNLYADLRRSVPIEDIIQRMRGDIRLELKSVEQKEDMRSATISFALSYAGRNPDLVARVTNTLASFYIEENLKARERQATGTAEFLKVQLADVKKRLDAQEALVSNFKKRYMGQLPQQTDANLGAIERINMQLLLNSDNQARTMERRDALSRQLADAMSPSPTAVSPEGRVDRLARLHEELRSLRGTYSDKYPDIIRLKQEIAELEKDIGARDSAKDAKPTPIVSPHVLRIKENQATVESELNILRNEEKRLRAALTSYVGRVENSPALEKELRELSRDYEATREYYGSLMKRYDDAQLAESMEQRQKGEQFRLIDAAVPASDPAVPNRLRLILLSLVASVGLAVVAVVVAEQVNPSFHSIDELRAITTVPVLLSIPLIVTPGDARRGIRRFRMAAVGAALGLVALVGVSYVVAHGNEQLVMMVTRGKA
jgi:polysaccharide biosynthesis transport protein